MLNFSLNTIALVQYGCALITARSPIYSHLGASLLGLATIRSFGAQKTLISEFDKLQDLHSSAFYLFISSSRAFGFWLDMFCVVYIAIVTGKNHEIILLIEISQYI